MPLRTFATLCAQAGLIAMGAYAALLGIYFFGSLVDGHTRPIDQTTVQAAKGR